MSLIPTPTTPRLILRGVIPSDIPAYERYFIDYQVIRHLSAAVPWPYPTNGVADWLNATIFPNQGIDRWLWGICKRETPEELIGAIELWREGRPEHRGFWLGHPFWGRGYMTEAAAAVNDCAFSSLGFELLVFENARGNTRSHRIKEKTGAHLREVRTGRYVDPELTEQEVWELTKDDWRSWREKIAEAQQGD